MASDNITISRFELLPTELRQEIYKLLATNSNDELVLQLTPEGKFAPEGTFFLLEQLKQIKLSIYHDAVAYLFTHFRLRLVSPGEPYRRLLSQIRQNMPLDDLKMIKHVMISDFGLRGIIAPASLGSWFSDQDYADSRNSDTSPYMQNQIDDGGKISAGIQTDLKGTMQLLRFTFPRLQMLDIEMDWKDCLPLTVFSQTYSGGEFPFVLKYIQRYNYSWPPSECDSAFIIQHVLALSLFSNIKNMDIRIFWKHLDDGSCYNDDSPIPGAQMEQFKAHILEILKRHIPARSITSHDLSC